MAHPITRGVTRRRLAGASAGALAALTLRGAAGARQRSVGSGAGIAGGGTVATDAGEAHFAVFGSRFEVEDEDEPVVFGLLRWVDPDREDGELTLESTAIASYGPVPDAEDARELTGTLRANGAGAHPFVLRLESAGPPGSGEDTLTLTVGAAAGATPETGDEGDGSALDYAVSGPLAAGDLELLEFDFDEASGA